VNGQFVVLKKGQAITFAPLPDRPLDSSPFTVTATASSNLPVAFASTTPEVCSVSGAVVTLAAVGPCELAASQAGDATFDPAAAVNQRFSVLPPDRRVIIGVAYHHHPVE
jgi:hypothetical protein